MLIRPPIFYFVLHNFQSIWKQSRRNSKILQVAARRDYWPKKKRERWFSERHEMADSNNRKPRHSSVKAHRSVVAFHRSARYDRNESIGEKESNETNDFSSSSGFHTRQEMRTREFSFFLWLKMGSSTNSQKNEILEAFKNYKLIRFSSRE